MELLDRSFPVGDQCWGLIGCAGTVAANVFSAGGLAVTLRVGNWVQNPDVGARQIDPEVWFPGLDQPPDPKRPGVKVVPPSVTLECVTPVHPSRDIPPELGDPFKVDLWPNAKGGVKATSIGAVLESCLDRLPVLAGQMATHTVVKLRTTDAYYTIGKIVSSLFGVILSRGGVAMGLELYRGPAAIERVTRTVIEHSGKVIEQKNADGTITRVPVQRSRNEIVNENVAPVYLVINKTEAIQLDDLNSIQSNESAYNPSWRLLGLLSGQFAASKPFHEEAL